MANGRNIDLQQEEEPQEQEAVAEQIYDLTHSLQSELISSIIVLFALIAMICMVTEGWSEIIAQVYVVEETPWHRKLFKIVGEFFDTLISIALFMFL